MPYWLLKTEPGNYSLDDLEEDGETYWDGVRNFQARNNLQAMKKGDTCVIYHSVGPKEAVGTAKVTRTAYQDPETDDPRWVAVDLAFDKRFKKAVTLAEMKADSVLSTMALVRHTRLSVCPVTRDQYRALLAASKK